MQVLEAVILYLVLFFPSLFIGVGEETVIAFSISRELIRIFIYNLPPLAFIWFLLLKEKTGRRRESAPFLPVLRNAVCSSVSNNINGFLTFILAFFGLLAINAGISVLSGLAERASGISFEADIAIQTPDTAAGWYTATGWFVLYLSCLSAGYLEESFFRYYLSDRLKEYGPYPAMLMSSVSFAFCHVYEGLFGVANALFAGLLLFFIFNKRKSGNGIQTLHAIAFAHGTYNALMYAAVALNV
ncbi:MAG: CPBP family intramembrane metalloprotease [Treponema sp.]|jgi:hypothetical protein|nr:CPBP family intramembrane metalloprotease [Treponema sp.]